MNVFQSILMALTAVKENKLRSFLTLLSISIGVFALMFVGSLYDSLTGTVSTELEALGETSITISKQPNIVMGNEWRKYRKRKALTYSVFQDLKKDIETTNQITASSQSGGFTFESGNKETDPTVSIVGTDENYFLLNSDNVSEGRALTADDLRLNRKVIVIGNDIVVKLFPDGKALGKDVKVGKQKFTIVGILESKGAVFGQSQDNRGIIPLNLFLKYYASWWDESLTIQLKATSKETIDDTKDEAIGLLRSIRNVKPWEENDFEIETNIEAFDNQFGSLLDYLKYFGWVVGGIALIAAGVGIMNIMLIAVKERTKEIGVRKAVGAKEHNIIIQFLIEAITLTQLGGLFGIILGVVAGNLLGSALGLSLQLPLSWIVFAVTACTVLGIIFGVYPAFKAAKLDPIDALRYE